MTEDSKLSEQYIRELLTDLADLLCAKNRKYGDSAISPIRIFSKASDCSGILVRLDDKLSRIKNSDTLRKNDVIDLMGYLTLLCISNGFQDLSDLYD